MKISQAKLDKIFLLLLALGLSLPLALTFFSPGGVSLVEKRVLAAPPGISSARDLAAFPAALDLYLNDNFGLRDPLVKLHFHLVSGPLFALIRHDALVGKDHWLFWGNEEALIDVRGDQVPPTDEAMRIWLNAFEQRRRWLRSLGSDLLVVLAPDKPSIYPEYLPDGIRAPGGATNLDYLARYLEKQKDVGWILNLKPVLQKKKLEVPEQLYYPADSHWNLVGAYWAVREMERVLGTMGFPVRSPIRREEIVPSSGDVGGEFLYLPDFRFVGTGFEVRSPALDCIEKVTIAPIPADPRAQRVVEGTRCRTGRYKVVMVRDSFAEKLKPFFSSTFERVLYVNNGDQRPISKPLIEAEKPDLVIYEIVERRLRLGKVLWEQDGLDEAWVDYRAR